MIIDLIDGTYELFRHFYGLRRFTKGEDRPFGAVLGVLNGVLEMIENDVTHVGVATDHVATRGEASDHRRVVIRECDRREPPAGLHRLARVERPRDGSVVHHDGAERRQRDEVACRWRVAKRLQVCDLLPYDGPSVRTEFDRHKLRAVVRDVWRVERGAGRPEPAIRAGAA